MRATGYALAEAIPGLPPLPSDDTGRHLSWVVLLSEPGFVYKGESIPVDEAVIDELVSEYATLTDTGYTAPVQREHTAEGIRFGDVLAVEKWKAPDGKLRALACVRWAIDDATAEIEAGRLKYTSGAFGPLTDDQGRSYEWVLTELSIVAAPHLKAAMVDGKMILTKEETTMQDANTATSGSESQTPPQAQTGEHEDMDMSARFAALEAAVSQLAERIAAMEPGEDEEDTAPDSVQDPEPPEDDEMAQLKATVASLTEERDRAIFLAEHGALAAEVGDGADLFNLWRHDRNNFGALAGMLANARQSVPSKTTAKPNPRPTPMTGVRLGEAGKPPAISTRRSDVELAQQAATEHPNDAVAQKNRYRELKAINSNLEVSA